MLKPIPDKYLFYVCRPSDCDDVNRGGLCWISTDTSPSSVSSAQRPSTTPRIPRFHSQQPSHDVLNTVRDNLIPFVCARPLSEGKLIWDIVCNPVAGGGSGKAWVEQVIVPLLSFVGIEARIHLTDQAGPLGMGSIRETLECHHKERSGLTSTSRECRRVVVVVGGDGTTSDFLSAITSWNNDFLTSSDPSSSSPSPSSSKAEAQARPPPCCIPYDIDLVLIPLGTANALFFSRYPTVDTTQPKDVLSSLLSALFGMSKNATNPQCSKESHDQNVIAEAAFADDGDADSEPWPISLSCVECFDAHQQRIKSFIGHVVVSTCLHASILNTANMLKLQESDNHEDKGDHEFEGHHATAAQGLDIFKQAFQMNQHKLWSGCLTVSKPLSIIYNPSTRSFDPLSTIISSPSPLPSSSPATPSPSPRQTPNTTAPHKISQLEGPFSYFTCVLGTVDRLEQKFQIAPLRNIKTSSTIQHAGTVYGSMDLVIVRPSRGQQIAKVVDAPAALTTNDDATTNTIAAAAETCDLGTQPHGQQSDTSEHEHVGEGEQVSILDVMKGAYEAGKHIEAVYDNGNSVVEYIRCSEWTWNPLSEDNENLVCIDGQITSIPLGGHVTCRVLDISNVLMY